MELDFHKDPDVLRDIVDAMAVGVFTVDCHGRFVAWSEGAQRITGYARHEVVGQPCHLLEGPNCKGFGRLTEMLGSPDAAPEGICNQECKVVAKSGSQVYIHGSVRVLRDVNGQIAGAVGSFTDVTSLVLANEKIAVLEERAALGHRLEELIGQSPLMGEVFQNIKLVANSDVTALITGESGTGKELAARAIHSLSERRDKPFLAVNCSAIPDNLLESELFGHVKGAFTGAMADKVGIFEAADHGTLFLDEIGDVSPAIQVKLLRVLQEGEIRRVGETQSRRVDVRLITATNKDLNRLVRQSALREDFYYRIHVFEIRMPPLRERKDDIPLLIDHFIGQIANRTGRRIDGITRDALKRLLDFHWPGNVRQLRNAIEHACVTVTGDRIKYMDLPAELRVSPRHNNDAADIANSLTAEQDEERDKILTALKQTGGNRTAAAKLLGVSRVTLWKKIGKYAIADP